MKHHSLLLAATLALSVALPSWAQTPINAPAGWKTQARNGGARTYTPPDLAAGEVYSVTIYDSASLNEQTLEEWLRAFAGKVGKGAGQLAAPLKAQTRDGRIVSGTGVYNGPKGVQLMAVWVGVSLDGGQNIHAARTLMSGPANLLDRYKAANETLIGALFNRAKGEAGDRLQSTPSVVTKKLAKVGGALVPGVYVGNQYHGQELRYRLRVYLYSTGEYRICNEKDEDLGNYGKTGNIDYNRNSGKLDLDWTMGLGIRGAGDETFCFFGRNQNGKPTIFAEDSVGYETHTTLTWAEPPFKRLSKTQEDQRKAEIEAEKNRYKWVVAPGKGVKNAQIAAILLDSKFNGGSADETVYLLLKDGTVYADLPVPPDELDIIRSRQKEADKWGKWRRAAGGYKVSWAGAPYQALPGSAATAAPAQQKLNGRWGTGRSSNDIIVSSYSLWGVTFGRNGRFKKDSRGGSSSSIGFGDTQSNVFTSYDDNGSIVSASGPNHALASERKKNPNGNNEGDYSINGYVLTLRYDNGKVKRLPFFFGGKGQQTIWFEGASMSLDDDKK